MGWTDEEPQIDLHATAAYSLRAASLLSVQQQSKGMNWPDKNSSEEWCSYKSQKVLCCGQGQQTGTGQCTRQKWTCVQAHWYRPPKASASSLHSLCSLCNIKTGWMLKREFHAGHPRQLWTERVWAGTVKRSRVRKRPEKHCFLPWPIECMEWQLRL